MKDRPAVRFDRLQWFGLTKGMAILLVFLFVGDEISSLLHLPLPGSVVGMVLLALALHRRWLPFEWVRPAAHLLIRHLSLLYIPPGVGVMVYFGLIRREWLPLVAAGVAGMAAVLVAVGVLQQRLERRG
jgi:holin-like protein